MKKSVTALELQTAINRSLENAGLGASFRVGRPSRIAAPTPDAPNWHFLDMLSGNIEEMSKATQILADARRDYTLAG